MIPNSVNEVDGNRLNSAFPVGDVGQGKISSKIKGNLSFKIISILNFKYSQFRSTLDLFLTKILPLKFHDISHMKVDVIKMTLEASIQSGPFSFRFSFQMLPLIYVHLPLLLSVGRCSTEFITAFAFLCPSTEMQLYVGLTVFSSSSVGVFH